MTCFMHAPHLSDSCDDKDCTPRPRTIVAAEQTDKMQNDAKEKGWDVTTKMATLKKIMKGATTPFVFKEDVTEQPRRRPNRVARSGRWRAIPTAYSRNGLAVGECGPQEKPGRP